MHIQYMYIFNTDISDHKSYPPMQPVYGIFAPINVVQLLYS